MFILHTDITKNNKILKNILQPKSRRNLFTQLLLHQQLKHRQLQVAKQLVNPLLSVLTYNVYRSFRVDSFHLPPIGVKNVIHHLCLKGWTYRWTIKPEKNSIFSFSSLSKPKGLISLPPPPLSFAGIFFIIHNVQPFICQQNLNFIFID